IAEGFGRGTQGEFISFLGYSLGSLNETQSHLCAAYDRAYLDKKAFGDLFQEGTEIRKMMIGFIKSMVLPGSGVKNMRKVKSFSEEVWELYERITGQERPELFRPKANACAAGYVTFPTTFPTPSSANSFHRCNSFQGGSPRV